MIITTNGILKVDSDLLRNGSLSEDEKKEYLYSMFTGEFRVGLLRKMGLSLEDLSSISGLPMDSVLTLKQEGKPHLLVESSGKIITKHLFNGGMKIGESVEAITRTQQVGSTKTSSLVEKLNHLNREQKLKDARAQRGVEVREITAHLMSKIEDMDLDQFSLSEWKAEQQKAVRAALRAGKPISVQTWIEAIDWFSSDEFWSKPFYGGGFKVVAKYLTTFLIRKNRFGQQSSGPKLKIIE